jgi:catechol 2,3-dioxygenase-like lactoylglutathione lyase family enzyme
MNMFENLTPNLMVKDVNRAVEFYANVLSFDFVMGVPEGTRDTETAYDATKTLVHAYVKKTTPK